MHRSFVADGITIADVGARLVPRRVPDGVAESARGVFAANLRRYREQAGISQHDLAVLAGLHRTEISLLERSLRSPRLETIVVLSTALGLHSEGALLEENDLAESRPM
jgi:DNA-binding XRE family transcriptional regulator